MRSLDKAIEVGMDAPDPDHQVLAIAEDEERERLIPDPELLQIHQVEGGAVAANMNTSKMKKWHAYWLLVIAVSVIVLNDDAAPKNQLFPPELAMFVVFLCAIWLILRAMKQMM